MENKVINYVYDVKHVEEFSENEYDEMMEILKYGIFRYLGNGDLECISITGEPEYKLPCFSKSSFYDKALYAILGNNEEEKSKIKTDEEKQKFIDSKWLLDDDSAEIYLMFDDDSDIEALLMLKDYPNEMTDEYNTYIKYLKSREYELPQIAQLLTKFIIYSRNYRKSMALHNKICNQIILQIEESGNDKLIKEIKFLTDILLKNGFRKIEYDIQYEEDKNV